MLYIFFFSFLVRFSVSTEAPIEIPCKANTEKGVKYRRITWYKVEENSDLLTGLVLKDLQKNVTRLFRFANHSYEVKDDHSLLVPGLTKKDCGVYRCTLWPPVGHYIKEGNAEYYSSDCQKPQVQKVRSREEALPDNHHSKFFIIPCVLTACAIVVMFLNYKLINKAKDKDHIKKNKFQADESI